MTKRVTQLVCLLSLALSFGLVEAKSCADFATQAEAQRYYDSLKRAGETGWRKLDRDGDGIACEALKDGPVKRQTSSRAEKATPRATQRKVETRTEDVKARSTTAKKTTETVKKSASEGKVATKRTTKETATRATDKVKKATGETTEKKSKARSASTKGKEK